MVESMTLDVEAFSARKVSLSKPYLEITNLTDVTPLVVNSLEEGTMSLVATYQGTTRVLKKISLSAYNADKLIRINSKLIVHTDTCDKTIDKVTDYLEVI